MCYNNCTMTKYHKIQTIFNRDPATKYKTFLIGEYSRPEFEYLTNNLWEMTEKIDGTNIRVIWEGERVVFGGKTDNAQIPAKLVTRLIELFFPEKFTGFDPDVTTVLYGEGFGAGIQKGGGKYVADGTSVDFILFDVRIGDIWLERKNVVDIAEKMGILVVPSLGTVTLSQAVRFVKEGFTSRVGECPAEGVVLRPVVEMSDRMGRRIITKLKHKDF